MEELELEPPAEPQVGISKDCIYRERDRDKKEQRNI